VGGARDQFPRPFPSGPFIDYRRGGKKTVLGEGGRREEKKQMHRRSRSGSGGGNFFSLPGEKKGTQRKKVGKKEGGKL